MNMALSQPRRLNHQLSSPRQQALGEAQRLFFQENGRPHEAAFHSASRLSHAASPVPWITRDFGPINYTTKVTEDLKVDNAGAEDELDILLPTFCEQPARADNRYDLEAEVPVFRGCNGVDAFSASQACAFEPNFSQAPHGQRFFSNENFDSPRVQWTFTDGLDTSEHALDKCRRLRVEEWRQDQSKHHPRLSTRLRSPVKARSLSKSRKQKTETIHQPDDDDCSELILSVGAIAGKSDQDALTWILKYMLHEVLTLGESMKSLLTGECRAIANNNFRGARRGLSWETENAVRCFGTTSSYRQINLLRERRRIQSVLESRRSPSWGQLDANTGAHMDIPTATSLRGGLEQKAMHGCVISSESPSQTTFPPTLNRVATKGQDEFEMPDAGDSGGSYSTASELDEATENWERTLNLNAIVTYIVGKFRKRQHLARGAMPMKRPGDLHRTFLLRRAIIKHHHPLVSSSRATEKPSRGCSELRPNTESSGIIGLKRGRTGSISSSVKRARTCGSSMSRAYWGHGDSSGSGEADRSIAWVEV